MLSARGKMIRYPAVVFEANDFDEQAMSVRERLGMIFFWTNIAVGIGLKYDILIARSGADVRWRTLLCVCVWWLSLREVWCCGCCLFSLSYLVVLPTTSRWTP